MRADNVERELSHAVVIKIYDFERENKNEESERTAHVVRFQDDMDELLGDKLLNLNC